MAMGNEETLKILIEAQNKAQKAFDEAQKQIKDTEKAHKTMTDKMEAASGRMKSVGNKMSLYLTVPLALLGKSMFTAAADFEQLQIAMETMLGSAEKAKTLLADLDKLAVKTPFQITEVQDAARQMLAYGIEADKIVETTKMLGDVSAGLGTQTFPQLTLAFGQIKAKGKLMGQELLQLTNAGFNVAEAMGVSRGELMKMMETGDGVTFEQVEKAFKDATSEGGRFHNMMENQSKTTSGQISNIKDQITLLQREMGANLLPIALEVVGVVKVVAKWFGKLSSGQQKAIVYAGLFVAALGPVIRVLGSVAGSIKSVVNGTKSAISGTKSLVGWVGKHSKATASNMKFQAQYRAMLIKENALKAAAKAKTIALTAAEKARMVATKVATAIQAAFNAVMAMNPIFLVVAAVVALVAVLVLLYKKNQAVRDFIDKAWRAIAGVFVSTFNTIKEAIGTAIDWIKNNWQLLLGFVLGPIALIVVGFMKYRDRIMEVFKAIWGVIKWAWDGIVAVVKWAWENVIKPIWDALVWYITGVVIPVWKKIFEVVKTVWDGIVTAVLWAWNNAIKPVWDLIWSYITNVVIPVWKKIFEVAKAVWDGVWKAVTTAWAWIKPIFEAVWAYIRDTLVPAFQKIWDKVRDVFTSAWNKISTFITNIKAGFNKIKEWIGVLVDNFTSIRDKIKSAFTTVGDAIKAPFKTAFNWVAGAWNKTLGKLNFTIPDWVPNIGGKKFDMPNMPTLYKGARDFMGGAAIVGDVRGQGGEIVNLPRGTDVYNNRESKRILRGLADGEGNGGGIMVSNTFTGNIYIADERAAKKFFEELNRQAELSSYGVPA